MIHIYTHTYIHTQTGALNFGKTWEIICFNQGRPKLRNLGDLHIERPMFQNLGVHFFAASYIETRGVI